MKIALICDTHWGVRNDASVMLEYLDKSSVWFFDTLKTMGIGNCIHLGDLVDRRKYISYVTANRLRTDFLDKLEQNNINTHIITGNHDITFKNTHEINALHELVDSKYKNIHTYTTAKTITIDNMPILLMPWLCDQNYESSMKELEKTKAQVVMGHLELKGFEMYKGSVNDHGLESSIFNKFDIVCSGHFHHRSSIGNINYLGAFGEYTWSDYNDPRGFTIFDTTTRNLQFIDNPYKMHVKLWYNDKDKELNDVMDNLKKIKENKFKNPCVKVIVSNKDNPYWFDLYINELEQLTSSDIQVVDDHMHLDTEQDEVIVNEAEDTITIFKKYVDSLNGKFSKPKLNTLLQQLYSEAIQIE